MKVPNGWTLKALSSQKLELTPRNQPINTTTNHHAQLEPIYLHEKCNYLRNFTTHQQSVLA